MSWPKHLHEGVAIIPGPHVVLLQFGANPNPNNEANAPLLSAIEIPDISVIQLLVNSGANVNFTNEKVNRKRDAINRERK